MNISKIKFTSVNSEVQFAIYGTDLIDAPLRIAQEGQIDLVKCAFNYKYSLTYANWNGLNNPKVNPMWNCLWCNSFMWLLQPQ